MYWSIRGNPEEDTRKSIFIKGITTKKFVETFRLADHVVVDGAEFVNGLLVIKLRVELPEETASEKNRNLTKDVTNENFKKRRRDCIVSRFNRTCDCTINDSRFLLRVRIDND